jgi:hypothetical protein
VLSWRAAIADNDWTRFVKRVLQDHYDPAYERSSAKHGRKDICLLEAQSLGSADVAKLAEKLAALV